MMRGMVAATAQDRAGETGVNDSSLRRGAGVAMIKAKVKTDVMTNEEGKMIGSMIGMQVVIEGVEEVEMIGAVVVPGMIEAVEDEVVIASEMIIAIDEMIGLAVAIGVIEAGERIIATGEMTGVAVGMVVAQTMVKSLLGQ